MKILKTILFLLALLSLPACSANTISKPYDLAIFDGQRVVTFSTENDQLEKLEERMTFDKPIQL